MCCRPLYLPLRSLLIVETFSISSSVSLDHSSSSLRYVGAFHLTFVWSVIWKGYPTWCFLSVLIFRIILDEAALFLSDKANVISVNLARGMWAMAVTSQKRSRSLTHVCFGLTDYVQVVDMGTLELRIIAAKPGADGQLVKGFSKQPWLRCKKSKKYFFFCILIVVERAQVWAALLQRRYSHQDVFGLLRRPHEPHSVRSQLRRPSAPSRTRAQTQQHSTEMQGEEWHQRWLVLQHSTKVSWAFLNMLFLRLSVRAGPRLRPLSWLTPSSRCCRIWWVKRWRRRTASMHQGRSRTVKAPTVSAHRTKRLLTLFYPYLQGDEKNRIRSTMHLPLTCSCSQTRAGILPKIQAPLIPSFTLL